jgi:hypothetical protein
MWRGPAKRVDGGIKITQSLRNGILLDSQGLNLNDGGRFARPFNCVIIFLHLLLLRP